MTPSWFDIFRLFQQLHCVVLDLCRYGELGNVKSYSNRIEFIGQTWTNLTTEMAHCYEVSTKFTTHAFNGKKGLTFTVYAV